MSTLHQKCICRRWNYCPAIARCLALYPHAESNCPRVRPASLLVQQLTEMDAVHGPPVWQDVVARPEIIARPAFRDLLGKNYLTASDKILFGEGRPVAAQPNYSINFPTCSTLPHGPSRLLGAKLCATGWNNAPNLLSTKLNHTLNKSDFIRPAGQLLPTSHRWVYRQFLIGSVTNQLFSESSLNESFRIHPSFPLFPFATYLIHSS